MHALPLPLPASQPRSLCCCPAHPLPIAHAPPHTHPQECNITYTPPNAAVASYGSVLLPLVVVAASMVLVELLQH